MIIKNKLKTFLAQETAYEIHKTAVFPAPLHLE